VKNFEKVSDVVNPGHGIESLASATVSHR
jgi:hypothetical protein